MGNKGYFRNFVFKTLDLSSPIISDKNICSLLHAITMLLRQQRSGWMGTENGNFCSFTVLQHKYYNSIYAVGLSKLRLHFLAFFDQVRP